MDLGRKKTPRSPKIIYSQGSNRRLKNQKKESKLLESREKK